MALAALELGKRRPEQAISDPGFFNFGGHHFRDDKKGGHGMVDMYKSIVHSCDTYYYVLANDMGIDNIAAFMGRLGLGQPHRHRHRGRVKGRAAVAGMEEGALQEARAAESGMPARPSRSASARATTPTRRSSWRRRRRPLPTTA
jgi:cell division protein FtsI/penicillin-binding protein 2